MAEFCDVSSHQRGLDMAAHAAAGYDRVLVKASEGTNYVNPFFGVWWHAAGALGLARGAYHFARPSKSSGAAEADHFHRTLRTYGGLGERDWVCLDVEEEGQERRACAHAAGFCERMAELGYRDGVVYSGAYYLGPAELTAAALPGGWRRLHVANYNPVADDRVPLPPGWSRDQLVARQYTSSASQPGIPGRSDANRIVREWLEEPVTEQDKKDIARLVLEALRDDVFSVQPPIRQAPRAGVVVGATYNKVGDAQSALARLAEQLGLVGVAVHAGRQEVAVVSGKVDALHTIAGTAPVVSELLELNPSPVEHMLAVLLDHLGVEYPPPSQPVPEQE